MYWRLLIPISYCCERSLSGECLRSSLMSSQHWFWLWLGADRQHAKHLSQYRPRSLLPYCATRPQCVNICINWNSYTAVGWFVSCLKILTMELNTCHPRWREWQVASYHKQSRGRILYLWYWYMSKNKHNNNILFRELVCDLSSGIITINTYHLEW